MSQQQQDTGNAAATAGSSASAAGRNATQTQQQQPAVNMASTYPSISNLLNHSLRYPICAVQGGSLIYSPMMGQTLFPWRPFTPVATPTTPVSAPVAPPNASLISPPTQTTPSRQQQQQQVSLAPLMQVPSYSYMTVSSLLGGASSSPSEDPAHQQYPATGITVKREKTDLEESQQPNTKRIRLTNEAISETSSSNNGYPPMGSQSSPASATRVVHSGGSSAASPTDSAPPYNLQYPPSALLRVMNEFYHNPPINSVLLLKCLGLVDSALLDQYCIKSLSLLQDLFVPPRPGFNSTPPALPAETYILLTINYLNVLRDGECINLEVLRWVFYNTLLAENQWVNYYRKHKKMTESTFVQLQFSHFTRILTHQSSSNVAVVVSQNSLSEGVILALQSIMKCNHSSLPKFYVVVAVLQNVPSEMCIVVTDQLHCRWLLELQQSIKSLSAIKELPIQPLQLSREILTSMKRFQTHLMGKVHSPFFNAGKDLISKDEANALLPPLSNIVEHRPKGPFTELYNIALVILQKVLNTGHLDRYQKLDFFIICPSYLALVTQLVKDIQESGLVQLLGIGMHRDEIRKAIGQRIVVCKPSSIEMMNSMISSNNHILYLVISKCSHFTSYAVLNHRTVDCNSSHEDICTCDCKSILSHSNTTILYTSAQPYALQTNRAFVTSANEIHWSQSSVVKQNHSEMSSGLEFCSLLKHKSGVPVDAWANVREDSVFEEKVLDLCKAEKLTTPISQVRAQVLLADYALALISMVKKKSSGPLTSFPETLNIVYDLIQRPLGNNRGRGSMVVLRCHNKAIGINFYNKLKAICSTLGLQYRFEIILDHGDGKITLSRHFQKRLELWGVVETGDSYSYLDLDHLPCLVIMTGKVRPSIRLPSSLSHIDLRLCHSHLTRTMYDTDMSLTNGYRNVSCDSAHLTKQPSPSNRSDKHLSTASSSSMISNEPHVVEWKPSKDSTSDHAHWDKGTSSPSYRTQFEYSSTEMDCTDSPAMNGGVAIVEIPQPEDHMTTRYNESSTVATETEENIFNDFDFDSDCEDSETENDDLNRRKITCLLSRQYYHIWQSRDALIDQSLLLPPSEGVVWQASSKWTNLSDHAPSNQSTYYRTWSKPEGKAKRVAMDTLIKENVESRHRCFLLTGPNQVGKMGASLLLIRLLHDYLRSSRGVTALNTLPTILPLIKTTPSSSPMATMYSPVVPMNYLISLCDNAATPTSPLHCPLSPVKQTTVQISAHPTIIHDSSHSCPKCSTSSIDSKYFSSSFHLSSTILCHSDSLSVQWHIPSQKAKSVAMTTSNQTLECIKLPIHATPTTTPNIPIFSISPDHKDSALLNLSHTAENNLHVVVTKMSNFDSYKSSWPNHIIAALPDSVFLGTGCCINSVLTLIEWNYSQNVTRLVKEVNTSALMPWSLILSDTVCMVMNDGDELSVDLSSLLKELITDEGNPDLISIRPWCEPRPQPQSHDFVLDSNFLLLNIAELGDINYNPLNFKSADIDYHLRLLSNGYSVHVSSQYSFVKKHIKADGPVSLVDLSPQLSSHPDRLVTSLHHDTSSLLSYPGPLLLETFLLHKSQSLFVAAHSPNNPVLMMEHYINLGPKVHVSLLTCRQLEDAISKVVFGGLVLYLCEGLVSSQMLQCLKFVKGACLLLITRDCKGLVREVSRLDIEEYWHFKLRDEFQTACGDLNQPLFFLTGKYLSSNVT